MNRFLPPDASCQDCFEVVQICLVSSDNFVSTCQQIPVNAFINRAQSPTLAEMAPTLIACGGLMALAWVFKVMINHIILKY